MGAIKIKKRPDGLYQKQITVEIKGQKKQKCFYGKTVAEINKKILAYHGEVEQGRTFEVVAEEWKEEHFKSLESNSLKNYNSAFKRAIEWLGEIPVKNITVKDINLAIMKFANQGYAQKTVATQLQIIRQILGYAVLSGDIEYNFAIAVNLPKNLSKTRREIPTSEELQKVKDSFDKPFSLFALLLLYTGCRRGEALALQYKDFDFDKKEISISKSVYHVSDKPYLKQPKTNAGNRIIPLLEPLEECLPKMKPDDFIFNYEGELLHNKRFSTLWRNYCKAVGIEITPHQLRHAYATRLYELGIDEKSAQDLMGHADIATTKNIYTHISDQKRKATAKQLQSF